MKVKKYFPIITFLLFLILAKNTFAQISLPNGFDSSSKFTIALINVTGNKKTKNYIVTRDIVFNIGDTINGTDLKNILDRTQKNIYNTALYTQVNVNAIESNKSKTELIISIVVIERWYIFPIPVFELYDRNIKEWRTIYNSDLNRVRYGVRFTHYNVSGRKDQLNINLFNGFAKELYFNYSQPYSDNSLQHGFSLTGGYSSKISINYIDSLNIGLPRQLNDSFEKPDYKLFKQQDYFLAAGYSIRNGNYARHGLGINYIHSKVEDTIISKNKNYFSNGKNTNQVLDFNYNYSYSKVDYYAYPLIGGFYRAGAKLRLGKNETNLLVFYASAAKYNKLSKKVFHSINVATSFKFSKQSISFYNLKTNNFEVSNIRGLEQYLIYSIADFSLKNDLKILFLDKKIKQPLRFLEQKFIPIKLYARTFIDGAYASLKNPNYSLLNNKLLYSYGFGLDIVTIYDFTFKLDFSFNQLGQKKFNF